MIDELTVYMIMAGIYSVAIAYFVFRWHSNKDKYLVRVKYPTEQRLLVKPEGAKLTLAKGKGRFAPAWNVDFDLGCLYFTKGWFSKRLTMDVMPDAKKAISYHRDIKETDIPLWTRAEHNEYATLTGLKALQQLGEQKTSLVMWLIVALQIIGLILPFVMGRIRF